MIKTQLIESLNKIYEKNQTWLEHLKELYYSYDCITSFLNETDINLSFVETYDGMDSFIEARTYINLFIEYDERGKEIYEQGYFTFDYEVDIEDSADEDDFIEKLLRYINKVEDIHERLTK